MSDVSNAQQVPADFVMEKESLDGLVESALNLVVEDLKNRVTSSFIVQSQCSESQSLAMCRRIVHTLLPQIVRQMADEVADVHTLDVLLMQSVKNEEVCA